MADAHGQLKTAKEPDRGKDSKRYAELVLRFIHHGFEEDLVIRRRRTSAGGPRVAAFETKLTGTITSGECIKDVVGGLVQDETWKLTTTHENQDTAFRLLVKRAIEKGTKRMRDLLAKPNEGQFLKSNGPKAARSYNSGRLAIGLLSMIKGGIPKEDEVLALLIELRKRPLIDTYTLGNALMALEAITSRRRDEPAALGLHRPPQKRAVPDDDKALMQKWTDRLLQNIDTRVDPTWCGSTTSAAAASQLAAGRRLYAAHLCGIEVTPTIWEAAANHLLDVQQGRREADRAADGLSDAQQAAVRPGKVTVATSSNRANGWSYINPKHSGAENGIWGSMTCAGITGLAICQAALLDYQEVKRRKLQNEASRARNDGFAWLAENMTVRYHPGAMIRQQRWLYYYLYGLERAALLSGVALIQDRDWYFEGAMMLVLTQLENGDWPGELGADEDIERNAMAILFLKQSTSPVLTGK